MVFSEAEMQRFAQEALAEAMERVGELQAENTRLLAALAAAEAERDAATAEAVQWKRERDTLHQLWTAHTCPNYTQHHQSRLDQLRQVLNELDGVKSERDQLATQIDRLAQWILQNVPGEPSRSEGAVDVAIRLLAGRDHLAVACAAARRWHKAHQAKGAVDAPVFSDQWLAIEHSRGSELEQAVTELHAAVAALDAGGGV